MPFLPPLPAWSAAHPIIVHFPIALLLAAPLAVLAALLLPRQRTVLTAVAAATVALGALGTLLATASGDAAEDAVPAGAKAVLERHEELAELARNLFLGLAALLTLGAAAHAAAARRGPNLLTRAAPAALALYLALHLAASAVLANAAHEGGRLVHEFGTRAMTPGSATPTPTNHSDDD